MNNRTLHAICDDLDKLYTDVMAIKQNDPAVYERFLNLPVWRAALPAEASQRTEDCAVALLAEKERFLTHSKNLTNPTQSLLSDSANKSALKNIAGRIKAYLGIIVSAPEINAALCQQLTRDMNNLSTLLERINNFKPPRPL